jgi:hypothetical protein
LAEVLGWPVEKLLSEMSSVELTKWIAYFKVKNFHYEQEAQLRRSEMSMRRR